MMEFSQLSVLIAAELLLGFMVLSGVLITLGMLRKDRTRQAARHLAERIQSDKGPRTERLKNRLAEHFRYADQTLDQAVHDLTQAEMRLYQNIINSYLKQDLAAFQQTDVDVENLVIAYQQLNLPDGPGEASSDAPAAADESAEIKRLQDENERLSEELRVTMDTMGRMLNEYSCMFSGGADNQLDKGEIMGMFQEDKPATVEETALPPESIVAQGPSTEEIQAQRPADTDVDLDLVDDSLAEDLEQVAIDIPDPQQSKQADPEAASLEEEWAKLLEEDAATAENPKDELAG